MLSAFCMCFDMHRVLRKSSGDNFRTERKKFIDDQNEYVIGATVVVVHEPSGTMYGAVTNVDGRYTIQGMRTGGPYKVEISYVGYQKGCFLRISGWNWAIHMS